VNRCRLALFAPPDVHQHRRWLPDASYMFSLFLVLCPSLVRGLSEARPGPPADAGLRAAFYNLFPFLVLGAEPRDGV